VAKRGGLSAESSTLLTLLEEGVEIPGYQMSAILNSFKVGGLITSAHIPQREEDVREHGGLLTMGVHSVGVHADLCHCS
jgi:hypothetical protein